MKRRTRTGRRALLAWTFAAWTFAASAALVPLQLGCATGTGDDTGESSGVASDAAPSPSSSPSAAPTNNYGYDVDAASPPASMPGTSPTAAPISSGMDATAPPFPSSDASAPPSTMPGTCDPNNPKYILELFTSSDAGACPCSASECCFSGLVCLPE